MRLYLMDASARDLGNRLELRRILGLFAAEGIGAIAFKGPVLNAALYSDRALREYGDLDLLVRPAEYARAKRALEGIGYGAEVDVRDPVRTPVLRVFRQSVLRNDAGRVVDLHWNLASRPRRFGLAEDEIWAGRVQADLGGLKVPTLAPEHLFYYLCFHGWKHGWATLNLVCDLAGLVDVTPGLGWEKILRLALRARQTRVVLLGCRLAAELMGAKVPEEVQLAARKEPAVEKMFAAARARLWRTEPVRPGWFGKLGLSDLGEERLTDRLMMPVYQAVMPTLSEWRAVRLPSGLRFLYYPYRWSRVLTKTAFRN